MNASLFSQELVSLPRTLEHVWRLVISPRSRKKRVSAVDSGTMRIWCRTLLSMYPTLAKEEASARRGQFLYTSAQML